MTFDQRVQAMQSFGFTHRQAAFLTTVMLHSGVCMPRQYMSFCGIKWGHNARDFFGRLTSRGYATAHHCWRKGGAFYHVHHKGLYRAIGEPDNRHRRRISIGRAAERLMILDVVLSHPDVEWLATEQEKVGYFLVTRSVLQTDLPSISFGQGDRQTVRYFTEKLPIGCGPRYEEVVFVYLVTSADTGCLERFLSAHRRLFSRLRWWTLRLVFPRHLRWAQGRCEAVAMRLFAPAVRPSVVEELRWYCHARRVVEREGVRPLALDEKRYAAARRAFGAQRFYEAYRDWLKDGDVSLNQLLSPLMRDAWQRGDVRVVSEVLPHRYLDIARAAGLA
jgi:hypothetical protein